MENCSYHDNAFVASRALHIVNDLSSNYTFNVLEWFFKNQVCLCSLSHIGICSSVAKIDLVPELVLLFV